MLAEGTWNLWIVIPQKVAIVISNEHLQFEKVYIMLIHFMIMVIHYIMVILCRIGDGV